VAVGTPRLADLLAGAEAALVVGSGGPAFFDRFDQEPEALTAVEELLIGGEALSVAHVRKAYAALPDVAIINGYGPTECTTFAATYRIPRDIDADCRSIPIGGPIANTTLYVLNSSGEPVPMGVIGELYIGGAGLARGYLARVELTAEKFVTRSLGAGDERLYSAHIEVTAEHGGVVHLSGVVGSINDLVQARRDAGAIAEVRAIVEDLQIEEGNAALARTTL